MKLSTWAKKQGVCYRTAWNMFVKNQIPGAYKLESGTIVVPDEVDTSESKPEHIVCYARVSSSQNKDNLESQVKRIVDYANANGYKVHNVIKEVGSGLNDNRPKLIKLLQSNKPTVIIVEHKDRLTRFGFNYIKLLCDNMDCKIEIINEIDNDTQDLMQDFVSLVTSFCARLYGLRRCKRKTEKLINELEDNK